MEKIILFGISLLVTVHLNGQSIAPQTVNSAGKHSVVNNIGIGFTIGELVVISQSDSQGNTINGGFTSGASLSTVSLNEPDSKIIGLTFFLKISLLIVFSKIIYQAIKNKLFSKKFLAEVIHFY